MTWARGRQVRYVQRCTAQVLKFFCLRLVRNSPPNTACPKHAVGAVGVLGSQCRVLYLDRQLPRALRIARNENASVEKCNAVTWRIAGPSAGLAGGAPRGKNGRFKRSFRDTIQRAISTFGLTGAARCLVQSYTGGVVWGRGNSRKTTSRWGATASINSVLKRKTTLLFHMGISGTRFATCSETPREDNQYKGQFKKSGTQNVVSFVIPGITRTSRFMNENSVLFGVRYKIYFILNIPFRFVFLFTD